MIGDFASMARSILSACVQDRPVMTRDYDAPLQDALIDYLTENPASSASDMVQGLDITMKSATSRISHMYRLGMLTRTGLRRHFRYSVAPV